MARRATPMERVRRAAANAHRLASYANTAVWRARKASDVLREEAERYSLSGCGSETIRAFVGAEGGRLGSVAAALERTAWSHMRETGALADLLGASGKDGER